MIFLYVFLSIIGAALLWVIADIFIAVIKKPIPDLPEEFLDPQGLYNVYVYLTEPDKIPKGVNVTEKYILDSLAPTIKYIENRYDCADFRLQLLFRLYKDCYDILTQSVRELIKKTCLGFKYWMDRPGYDSMCYWSENHQILFAVSEYLHGQEWQDELFINSGMTGKQHMETALKRINIWMEQRFLYGFSEWLSNNYWAEDIAPMSNYIQYSRDKESVERMKIIFDLLWFNVAAHSANNTFVGASSRMYGDNKSSHIYGNRLKLAMAAIWEGQGTLSPARSSLEESIAKGAREADTSIKLTGVEVIMMQNFIAMYKTGAYKLPKVIYNIALDKSERVIKTSEGLSVEDLEKEGLIGQGDKEIMAQLGAETFTNPPVVMNTLKYLSRHKMFRNKFVSPFRFLDIKLLRLLNVPYHIAKKLDLMTHGIALGRGNIYCYRTKYYTLTTAMAHNTDYCGAQGHIWTANIAPDLTLYTTQPARDDGNPRKHSASPGYWIGNGRQPMSVQDKNINITIYKLPKSKRPLEFHISDITHAYLPKERYDELEFIDNYAFGRKGKVLVAFIASGKPKYRPYDAYAASVLFAKPEGDPSAPALTKEFDYVLSGGNYHAYITELSDTDTETFHDFIRRILANKIAFKGDTVEYHSGKRRIKAAYSGLFEINGNPAPTRFIRHESAYAKIERKANEIAISHGGHSLKLNYYDIIREESR